MSISPVSITCPGRENQNEDVVLLSNLRSRDPGALAALYDRYGRIVFSLAARILDDARESEEVTQDVFLALWNNPTSYRPAMASPLTWIASITRNKCIDRLRRAGRRIPHSGASANLLEIPAENRSPDPLLTVGLNDLTDKVRDCLDRLPEAQRATVESAYFESLDIAEIADRSDLPAATVKSRLRLALDKMRRCLRHKAAA